MSKKGGKTDFDKIYPGRRGNYKILKSLPNGMILVEYISGNLNGTKLEMHLTLHRKMQENIARESKVRNDRVEIYNSKILDILYKMYPATFNVIFSRDKTEKEITEELENNYPIIYGQIVDYLDSRGFRTS